MGLFLCDQVPIETNVLQDRPLSGWQSSIDQSLYGYSWFWQMRKLQCATRTPHTSLTAPPLRCLLWRPAQLEFTLLSWEKLEMAIFHAACDQDRRRR